MNYTVQQQSVHFLFPQSLDREGDERREGGRDIDREEESKKKRGSGRGRGRERGKGLVHNNTQNCEHKMRTQCSAM